MVEMIPVKSFGGDVGPRRPFGEFGRLRREMEDLWSRFFGESPFGRSDMTEWLPSVDIAETDSDIRVHAELPGMNARDIDISISGDVLNIKGEKKKEEERKGENFYSSERCFGSFQRSFQLPANVDNERIEADFKNGVLTIRMPKSEQTKTKKIEIKSS